MDCYTPYPVEEAAEAIGFHRNYVPLICLVGGLMGLAAMFLMETWVSVLAYPVEHRRPSAIFLARLHYPGIRVDHPLGGSVRCFRHAGHVRATAALSSALQCAQFPYWGDVDKFFLCLEANDPKFELVESRSLSGELCAGFGGGGGVLIPQQQSGLSRAQSWAWLPSPVRGCRQDMQNQPKFVPQRSTTFFADGRSVRAPGRAHRGSRPAGGRQLFLHRPASTARKPT